MIEEITCENSKELKDSFLSFQGLKEELENNPFGKVLVLKEENQIIGYIYYSEIYERVEINQFEIDPTKRNLGKGDFLLKELISRVKKDITLEVREDNTPALSVYLKNGFQKKAIRKGYYHGVDGILMEKKAN